jgi:hypothetical protein
MEGVSKVMPLALNVGTGILKGVLSNAAGGGGGSEISEAEQLRTRQQAEGLREENQHRRARARVAAAGSGLDLSGTSLLNLQSLEHHQEDTLGQLLGDSSRRTADILASGAEQAQSIRLSGRRSRVSDDGLGSLLRLGGQVFGGGSGGKGEGKNGGSGGFPIPFPIKLDWPRSSDGRQED